MKTVGNKALPLNFKDVPNDSLFYVRGEARVKREYLMYVSLDNPTLGQVQDTGIDDGQIFLSMADSMLDLQKNKDQQTNKLYPVPASVQQQRYDLLEAENLRLKEQVTTLTLEVSSLKRELHQEIEYAISRSQKASQPDVKRPAKKAAKSSAKKPRANAERTKAERLAAIGRPVKAATKPAKKAASKKKATKKR